jgi:hypothetical protein
LTESFDRYELKLNKQVSKLLMEWSDVIAFGQTEVMTKTAKAEGFKPERTRALTTGRRIMHLEKSPAFDAGNRFSLPSVLPLEWEAYESALRTARGIG